MMPNDQNLIENMMQKVWYVNPCLMGLCEKFLNAGTEQLGSHREKNRYAAYMWPKAAGSDFLLFWIYLLVCSQYIKTCEFALFWAQILRAVAANTVGLQACSLYKIRTLGQSLGSDFLRFLIKLIIEKLQVTELEVSLLLFAERADSLLYST